MDQDICEELVRYEIVLALIPSLGMERWDTIYRNEWDLYEDVLDAYPSLPSQNSIVSDYLSYCNQEGMIAWMSGEYTYSEEPEMPSIPSYVRHLRQISIYGFQFPVSDPSQFELMKR